MLDSWARKPPSIDWAVAAAAGVAGETSERGLRLLGVQAGDTLFVDGGAGGVGAVAVQMALARKVRVIASASEANQDYLREIGAIPVRYGQGMADRVRAAAGGRVDAVFDVAGKTAIEELIRLVSEPGLAGMEVVECSPPYDHAEQTSLIAGRVVLDCLAIQVRKGVLGRRKAELERRAWGP